MRSLRAFPSVVSTDSSPQYRGDLALKSPVKIMDNGFSCVKKNLKFTYQCRENLLGLAGLTIENDIKRLKNVLFCIRISQSLKNKQTPPKGRLSVRFWNCLVSNFNNFNIYKIGKIC